MIPTLLIVMARHRTDRGTCSEVWDTVAIAVPIIAPTGYERRLPPGVQLTVHSRRRALAGRARGRVLDLGGAASHDAMWEAAGVPDATRLGLAFEDELADLAESGERFDTVLSVFRLIAAADLAHTVSCVRRVLAADGQVLFLEPGRRSGTAGRAQRLAAPGFAVVTGWHLDRDVPSVLRRSRLSITDLQRHRTSTVQWWLRCLLEGTAHHALRLPRT